jgi:hypothetical protein
MKTIKFFMMAAVFLVAGFTGCVNDGPNNENNDSDEDKKTVEVEDGITTYATFKFSVEENGPGTRANATMENDGSEFSIAGKVKKLRLFVFKTGSSTVCELNKPIDIVNAADSIITVKVSSGTKRIFVLANESVGMATLLSGIQEQTTTLAQFYETIYDLGNTPSFTNINKLSELIDATQYGPGYLMSNPIDKNSLQVLAANIDSLPSRTGSGALMNNFHFNIQRAVAKTSIKLINDGIKTIGKGSLSDIYFVAKNVNRSVRLFQKFDDDMVDLTTASPVDSIRYQPHAPYYTEYDATAVAKYPNRYYAGYTDSVAITSAASTQSYYLTENTNLVPQLGNSTYAAIIATYKPGDSTVIITDDFSKLTYSNLSGVIKFEPEKTVWNGSSFNFSGKGLYQLRGVNATGLPDSLFFTDKDLAYTVAYILKYGYVPSSITATIINELKYNRETNNTGLLVYEYPNRRCYYRLNLGQYDATGKLIPGVKRNHNYKVVISKFSSIGEPSIEDLNRPPQEPLGGETWITARITIDNWRDVDLVTPL